MISPAKLARQHLLSWAATYNTPVVGLTRVLAGEEHAVLPLAVYAKTINEGECGDFAEGLVELLHRAGHWGAFRVVAEDVLHRSFLPKPKKPVKHRDGSITIECGSVHCWTYLDGLHYDAEATDGVADWRQLPFFVRWRGKGPVLRRRTTAALEARTLECQAAALCAMLPKAWAAAGLLGAKRRKRARA